MEFKDSVETVENASMLSGYSLKAIIKTLHLRVKWLILCCSCER
ncbi:MAG: hypothetical protein QXN97_04795 [Desulfurococcaceae archaeon]